jgi:hypothetical protein
MMGRARNPGARGFLAYMLHRDAEGKGCLIVSIEVDRYCGNHSCAAEARSARIVRVGVRNVTGVAPGIMAMRPG